jgi:hypothetical protein
VSPVRAKVCWHSVRAVWGEKVVKPPWRGEACLLRSADDGVGAFAAHADAGRFDHVRGQRREPGGRALAGTKTRIISFRRHQGAGQTRVACLGVAVRWGKARKGKEPRKRRTARQTRRNALQRFTAGCQEHRPRRLAVLCKRLHATLRGDSHYDGVHGNAASLQPFFHRARRIVLTGLTRRRPRHSDTWPGDKAGLERLQVARPRLVGRPKTRQAALKTSADLRQRVCLKSPVREHRTPGSVRVATRSRTSSCYAGDIQDITWCSATSTLPRHAARATGRYEALGTREPHQHGGAGPVRRRARLPASRRSGAGSDDRAHRGEPLIHVVRTHKPKRLTGLNHKVRGQVEGLPHHLSQMLSHRRTGGASLIHGTRAERGQPVSLP